MLYQAEGLKPPAEVVESTSAYFLEQDTLGRWLATLESCRPHEGVRARDLFDLFKNWCGTEAAVIDPHTLKAFCVAISKRGIESKEMRGGTQYALRCKSVPAAPRTTAKAGAWSYDQYRAAGWTDEQMVTEGLLVVT